MFKKNPVDKALDLSGEYAFKPITLPHDAMITEQRRRENPSGTSGAYYPGGSYTYICDYVMPAEEKGKTVLLEFEGVYNSCTAIVNGHFAASHKYGYTGFFVDIAPYLQYGQENRIEVRVNNIAQPSCRWYTGAGIYRPVWILTGEEIHIKPYGLKVTTPEAAEDVSLVQTQLDIRYTGNVFKTVEVKTQIRNASGESVAQETSLVTLMPFEDANLHQRIYVRNAELWSLEDPNLYSCEVTVSEGERVWDEEKVFFGIRHIQMDPVHGLRLNGKAIKLRGACIHHDNGVLGAAAFARAEERRVELCKKAGFNSIRSAHNPASKALLDACDRLGILVMEESFDTWVTSKREYDYAQDFADHWEEDLKSIVDRDFNHPSVFMYSIGNEIHESCNSVGAVWNRKLANKVRELDPSRFVTNAINGMFVLGRNMIQAAIDLGLLEQDTNVSRQGDVNDLMTALCGKMNDLAAHPMIRQKLMESCGSLDLTGYNYMRGAYMCDTEDFPNRMIYGSETLPPDIDLNWKLVKENPQILGDYTWTGWDYIGEAGIGVVNYNEISGFNSPWPCYLAYCGDMDLIGHRRPMSYYREIVFGLRSQPYLSVQRPNHYHDKKNLTPWTSEDSVHSWTWHGYENEPCVVEVYSDAEEVELLCNGESLGRKPAGEAHRFKALFETQYVPGKLEAVAYRGGTAVGSDMLCTAGEGAFLSLSCDRQMLLADGQDLAYIDIMLVDPEGNLNTADSCAVSVNVEGPAVLQGIGNADPCSEENFAGPVHKTFDGRLLAVVRAVGAGEIKVSAQIHDGEPTLIRLLAV